MSYPTPSKLPTIIGPSNCLVREDFFLIGIGLRMAEALAARGEDSEMFKHDLHTLNVKAQKFIERYDLNPKDHWPDRPAQYRRGSRKPRDLR